MSRRKTRIEGGGEAAFHKLSSIISMLSYLSARLLRGIGVIAISVVIVFFVVRMVPADPVTLMVSPFMDEAAKQAMIIRFGLDKPVGVQFLRYVNGLFHGDLGISFSARAPVMDILMKRLGWTLLLMFSSLIFTVFLGIILGVLAAVKKGSLTDRLISVGVSVGVSVFTPFIAFLLLYVFAFLLRWLPSDGAYTPPPAAELAFYKDVARHIVLPAVSLMLTNLAQIVMQMRSSMGKVLEQEYIRTAYAKGCRKLQVIKNHALKNSMIPLTTIIGMQLGTMVGGSVLVETIFSWPGIGKLLMDAVMSQDYPLMQGVFLLMAVSIVLMNIMADIVVAALDPRIRLGGKR